MSPLSTSTVTSQRPTLHWAPPPGTESRVTLCRDRALSVDCVSLDVTGDHAAPDADLAPGVWFWRVANRVGAVTTSAVGPVWQFTVGYRTAPRDRSWGSTLDLNGDGYADLAVSTDNTHIVYVYLGGPGDTALTADPVVLRGPQGSRFGRNFAAAGDVNGDGFGDLVTGADGSNAAYVYLGRADLTSLGEAPIVLNGPVGSAGFGGAVGGTEDVNRDGYADVVVGAPASTSAYVYLGGAGETALRAAPIVLRGAGGMTGYGAAVGGLGDVNDDGYADLGVGANMSARATVYLGGAGETALRGEPITLSGSMDSWFGGGVAGAGDVNGDGFADFIIGAHNISRSYVFLGRADASDVASTEITLVGPMGYATLGGGDSVGDLNRDGYGDFMALSGSVNAVNIYLGGPATALQSVSPIVLRGPAGSAYFGSAGAGVGDVNGDGYADFAVGAFLSDSVYVYLGGPDAPAWEATPIVLRGPSRSRYGVWLVRSDAPVDPDDLCA